MFARVLASFFLTLLISTGHDLIEDRIQGAGGADFTYNSHVKPTSDGKQQIINSITNHGDLPLSVSWEDGGLICTGFSQIKSKETQVKKVIAQEPYIYDHSVIKYGNSLQYSSDVRCYLDRQARPKDRTRTEVIRQDGLGREIFKIEVSSEISQGGQSASIDLTVKGRFNLILPSRVAAELKTASKGPGWEVIKTTSLNRFEIRDEDRATILRWLDKTPMPKQAGPESDLVVLLNRAGQSNEISLPLIGENWSLEQVYIIAYMSNTPGVLGFTADVYLPK